MAYEYLDPFAGEPPAPLYEPNTVDPATGDTWADIDLSETVTGVLDGTLTRPAPSIGRIHGAGALLYPGKVHGVHGVGGAGKTWLAACVIAERLAEGEHVMLVDLEDTPATIVERLVIDLQIPPATILAQFHYKRPTEPTIVGLAELHRTVNEYGVTLVVLDSVGEALAGDGVRQNEDAEVAGWFARFARSTAGLGPAVLLLDHVPKADERSLFPIGSQRKQAAMNGVIYSLQRQVPFSREIAGSAVLVVGKDRQGAYAHGQRVAELRVTPQVGRTCVELVAPTEKTDDGDAFRPTRLMEKVSRALEVVGEPLSYNGICDRVTGKREYLRAAVDALVERGHVTKASGPRGATLHSLARPYREAADRFPANVESDPDRLVTGSGSLGGEPGTSHLTGSGNQSGTAGNQSPGRPGRYGPVRPITGATAVTEGRNTVTAVTRNSACSVCGDPMLDLGDGASSHATCEAS